ncbi:PEN2-like protein, partial [Mya arenaria]
GFALLPFLWFVNSVWFFREAFLRPHFEEQKQMHVMRSILGSVLWICAIVTWVTVFQLKRAEWGPTADYMSFIIPRGEL